MSKNDNGDRDWNFVGRIMVNGLIGAIISLSILAPVMVIVLMINKKMDSVAALGSLFLSAGIAIIGVAIAIWAGLNISSAVSKKEVESAKKDVSEIKKAVTETSNVFEEAQKSLLLSHVREMAKIDYASLLYVRDIECMKPDTIPEGLITRIIRVDSDFTAIYNRHDIERRDEIQYFLTRDLIKEIDSAAIEYKDAPEKLLKYLHHRQAEARFYQGYTQEGKKKIQEYAANNPAVFYQKELDRVIEIGNSEQYDSYRMQVYLGNTIAESYSLQLRKCTNTADNSFEATFRKGDEAFQTVIRKLERSEFIEYRREVYYRNYACFLEYYDDICNNNYEHRTEIIKYFNEAIRVTAQKGTPSKIREYREALKYYVKVLGNLSQQERKNAEHIYRIGIETYPENIGLLKLGLSLFGVNTAKGKAIKSRLEFLDNQSQ